MILPIIINLVISLAILLVSSKVFLSIAQSISVRFKFSPLFVSLVVVALATNLPELTITVAALVNHDAQLAMANLTGSSIVNITLIFGLSVIFGAVRIGTKKTPKNAIVLLLVTVLFAVMQFSGLSFNLRGTILVATFSLVLMYQYLLALNGRFHEDKKLLVTLANIERKKRKIHPLLFPIAFIVSLAGLIIAGNMFVTGVENLSSILNISTTILGLTLTAVATSAPELILSMMATIKKNKQDSKIVIGTLIGSNIINLTILPAMVLFVAQKIIVSQGERLFLLVSTLLFVLVILRKKGSVVNKAIGIVFLLLFIAFTVLTFAI